MSLLSLVRQISRVDLSRLDGGDEDALDCLAAIAEHPGGGLVLAGLTLANEDEVVLRRMITFALRAHPITQTWPAWTILLLPPYDTDLTVLLNTLAGVQELGRDEGEVASIPRSLVPGFLLHALDSPAVVAERAVSVALSLPAEAWAPSSLDLRDQLPSQIESVIAIIDEQELQLHWVGRLKDVERIREQEQAVAVEGARAHLGDLMRAVEPSKPRKLAALANEYIEAYLGTGATGVIRPVQVLELASRRPLTASIWEVVSTWSEFFHQIAQQFFETEDLDLRLSNAATGSLRVDHLLEMPEPGDDVDGLTRRLEIALSEKATDYELDSLLRFLGSVAGDPVSLRARHYWGRHASTVIERKPAAVRALRMAASDRRVIRVPSLQVPQADRLEKIIHLVELTNRGEAIFPDSIEVGTQRQVDYYKRASKILGLLDEDGVVTPAGRQLVRLDVDQRYQLLAVLFETSLCGAAWIEWSGARTLLDVDPATAAEFVHERGIGVTGSTIGRRVQSLQAWWKSLVPYHYAQSRSQPPT